jgi:hypothetical protein
MMYWGTPQRVATTGVPDAMASAATVENDSRRLRTTTSALPRIAAATSAQLDWPAKRNRTPSLKFANESAHFVLVALIAF